MLAGNPTDVQPVFVGMLHHVHPCASAVYYPKLDVGHIHAVVILQSTAVSALVSVQAGGYMLI